MEILHIKFITGTLLLFYSFGSVCNGATSLKSKPRVPDQNGFVKAADYSFSPETSGRENVVALQRAVDKGGTVVVSTPGTYEMSRTVYISSNTSLKFGNNVLLKKADK